MLKINQGDIVCDYISNVLSDIYLVLGYDKHFELGCCYNMIVNGYDAYKQAKYQSTMLFVVRTN